MCLPNSRIRRSRRWNWDGEYIIHDSVVPSSRPVVKRQKGNYDIDVREFLVTQSNAVIRRLLRRDIRDFIVKELKGVSPELFDSRTAGSFDLRVHVITEYVSRKIRYQAAPGIDPWQFPEETLKLGVGDCEDRALLIASLLLASGISSFNVRVALGQFRTWTGKRHKDYDHVWVMYKDESGKWQIIEPAHISGKQDTGHGKAGRMPDSAEYIPVFVFNDVHLWAMQRPPAKKEKGAGKKPEQGSEQGGIELKRNWSGIHPKFAGWVHQTILNEALEGICPDWVLKALNRHFTSFLWQKSLTVDDIDLPGNYDPRDHFDNGYITESWDKVTERLKQFGEDCVNNLDAFHSAAHSIGDFYAHSSYAGFGKIGTDQKLALYDPANPSSSFGQTPSYDAGSPCDISSGRFTVNQKLWQGQPGPKAAALWKGKLISGRYGQKGENYDSHTLSERITESITFIPKALTQEKGFSERGALPHHNEIAVDEETGENRCYDRDEFARQYRLRKDAAVRHIRRAFQANWKPADS